MATTKTALGGKPVLKAPKIVSEDEAPAFHEALRKRISERAYGLFESSGGQHGNADNHWNQAELEVLQHGMEIRESGSWLAINAAIPDGSADDIQIYLTPNRVVVRAEKNTSVQNPDSHVHGMTQREIFLADDLASEVEPETASAAFKDQKLTIMVKKRYPMNSSSSREADAKG